MPGWPHPDILAGRLVKTSSTYSLAAPGSLPPAFWRTLHRLGVNAEQVSGVLLAEPVSGLPHKLLDGEAHRLWSGLTSPRQVTDEPDGRLLGLVFDSVLEAETDTGYVEGPAAFEALCTAGFPMGSTRLSRLSRSALEYLERLRLTDEDLAVGRLYGYNRIPVSRYWERAYPGGEPIRNMLPGRVLSRHWRGPHEASSYWLSWTLRERSASDEAPLPYKLYVSPRPEVLADLLPGLIEALTSAGADRFKLAPDAAGVLRPDKIVVYLPDARATQAVLEALDGALQGFPPHGVPFTAELAGDGLISWGGDPPPQAAPIGRRSESWRVSVCRRLSEGLLAGQRSGLKPATAVDFALTRLGLDGVRLPDFAPTELQPPTARRAKVLT